MELLRMERFIHQSQNDSFDTILQNEFPRLIIQMGELQNVFEFIEVIERQNGVMNETELKSVKDGLEKMFVLDVQSQSDAMKQDVDRKNQIENPENQISDKDS